MGLLQKLMGMYSIKTHDSVVAVAFLIPITLETLAALNGFQVDDHSIPCDPAAKEHHCVVKLGDSWIDTSAFYFFTNSLGVAIQALLLIGMGSLADHGSGRKTMMLAFGALGALTTACYLFIDRPCK